METLYSGLSQLACENAVILWAFVSGFRLPEKFNFQNEVTHDEVYEESWYHLLNSEDHLYEVEQDLNDVWHFTRIFIGDEWETKQNLSLLTPEPNSENIAQSSIAKTFPRKMLPEHETNIVVPQQFLV
jgi:hypothetical protein